MTASEIPKPHFCPDFLVFSSGEKETVTSNPVTEHRPSCKQTTEDRLYTGDASLKGVIYHSEESDPEPRRSEEQQNTSESPQED